MSSIDETIKCIKSVIKTTYVGGRVWSKRDLTPDDYREEWEDALFDKHVRKMAGQVTHKDVCTLHGHLHYMSSQNFGTRWSYEIKWKGGM